VPVRTTLTIDDDVSAKIAAEARRSGKPLRVVVNEALRIGLENAVRDELPPYRVEARDMKLRPGIEIDDIQGLLDKLDGPLRR
jgi:hypothetical protein